MSCRQTKCRSLVSVTGPEYNCHMATKGRNIIVIGTSAGGLEALDQLIGQLPTDLPASIVIVQHMDPGNSGEPLLRRLGRHQAFHPKLAEDGERIKPGHIYIA